MKPQFKQLVQIGILVRDVEQAVECYQKEFGMGPWTIRYMNTEEPFFSDLTVGGKPSDLRLKIAFIKAYGMEIELIEPQSDSVYREWLDKHGPGVHHINFMTEDSYETFLEKTEKYTGKAPWIRGQAKKSGVDFTYFDLREQLGLIVEVTPELREGCTAIDYDA